ncbi:hypothetical protein N9L94_03155 [Robiginitalea sp.]|nr:hypothetical protein [Robiginitalea sp.]
MTRNLIHIFILQLWVLSIVAAPVAWILLPEDNVSLTLNNGWEEESGESDLSLPDFDKLVHLGTVFTTFMMEFGSLAIADTHTPRLCGHISDVIIPPPEESII